MAGPGIRYHYMAELLSKDFDVTVGFFDQTYLPDTGFEHSYATTHIHPAHFESAFEGKDILIAMWVNMPMINYCNNHLIFLVIDMYAPAPVENLALYLLNGENTKADTDYIYQQSNAMYKHFLTNGDLFLCSNRRQLDFWIGFLFGTDQVRVSGYKQRSFYERFVYAPMGIDTHTPLQHTRNVMRGVIKGVDDDSKIILWTGGIWNWFDAQVLMRAMNRLKEKRPDIKLVFFGTKHPNPDVPAMKEAADALETAKQYDLLDKTVFMHQGWVPYPERINYLLEANAAVNTTKDMIETEFSHRTRVLDHFLTKLPTIATSGDYLTDDVIVPNGAGIGVPAGDDKALANAIEAILDDENHAEYVNNIEKVRELSDWSQTLAPLRDALLSGLPKLTYVPFIEKPKELPKNPLVEVGKKVIPKPIKKIILRLFKYGQ